MSVPQTKPEVFRLLVAKMAEMFELEAATITAETHLFTDLDLDSIDAIDLAVQLQEFSGTKVAEEALRELRTVGDIGGIVMALRVEKSG